MPKSKKAIRRLTSTRRRDRIPMRIHPRVFSEFGERLVTDDFVAIAELVKNSYDAFATHVDIRFVTGNSGALRIEIEDNGHGMSRDTIENVWCVVATPFRVNNPVVRKGRLARRASGEKGIGRLCAARLGSRMSLTTKARGKKCWHVAIDWTALADAADLSDCSVLLSAVKRPASFSMTGTRIAIRGLRRRKSIKVADCLWAPRSDGIVPVAMKLVAFQVHALHFLVGHLAACRVFASVQAARHCEAFRRGRSRDQLHDRLVIAQRFAAPV